MGEEYRKYREQDSTKLTKIHLFFSDEIISTIMTNDEIFEAVDSGVQHVVRIREGKIETAAINKDNGLDWTQHRSY